jgi:hypothetical protein
MVEGRSATPPYRFRQQVLDFLFGSEALLSPALRPSELTNEECAMIAEYVLNLSQPGNPWSKLLPFRDNF